MLVNSKNILVKATKGKYGVGAFNFVNMEVLQAIIQAANEEKAPVMVCATEGAIKYIGYNCLKALVEFVKIESKVPVAIHLDHGQSFDVVKKVIDCGFTSVMIDASKKSFEDNIKITKKIVTYAHKRGVSVEAELGTIGGEEDGIKSRHIIYTDPKMAKEFVSRTGCDALAVAIGTSHGAYKFKGKTKLNFDVLKKIRKVVSIPLVLHGASSIPVNVVSRINRNGGKVMKAHGVDDINMKKAVKLGISKVNTDTDLRLVWTGVVREVLKKNKGVFDIRKIAGPARSELVSYIKGKIKVIGSSGKV